MEITFLRHAQSIFNRDHTSEKDCELTDVGIEQAKQLTGRYDIIICSIMKRAKQTLEYSQLTSTKVYFTDLCREVRVDICDFLEGEDETQKETDEEVQERISKFREFLLERMIPGQTILVVCHRDFIHAVGKKQLPSPENVEFQNIEI